MDSPVDNRIGSGGALSLRAGMLFCCIANVLFTFQDAMVKQLLDVASVTEILMTRSAVVLVVCAIAGRRRLAERIVRTRIKRPLVLRGFVMLVAWVCFYEAAKSLPLGELVTLYFVSPAIVALISGPLLGERVGGLQWVAVALGFAGVAAASGMSEFRISLPVGFVLTAACLWAFTLVMLRRLSAEEGPLVQVVYTNGVFLAATAGVLAFVGFDATAETTLRMLAVGVVSGLGQIALYAAVGRISASALATLEYISIVLAFTLGYLMFGDLPSPMALVGAALVVLSGVLVVATQKVGPERA